jgi:hypothetical protein
MLAEMERIQEKSEGAQRKRFALKQERYSGQ